MWGGVRLEIFCTTEIVSRGRYVSAGRIFIQKRDPHVIGREPNDDNNTGGHPYTLLTFETLQPEPFLPINSFSDSVRIYATSEAIIIGYCRGGVKKSDFFDTQIFLEVIKTIIVVSRDFP